MPKLGFVDCISNAFDGLELASTIVDKEFAGTTLQRLTAPELLKIPVCVKKLLNSDSDAVIVFVTAIPDDVDSLHLLVEKTIDLELAFQKYVFYCIVSEEEFSSEGQFKELAQKQLYGVIDLALKALHSPSEVSSQIGSGVDFSMFAAFAQGGSGDAEGARSASEAKPAEPQSGGNSLF